MNEHRRSRAIASRRTFVRALGTAGAGAVALGAGWRRLVEDPESARPLTPGSPLAAQGSATPIGPYGVLAPADANDLRLPVGFASRVVARTGERVADGDYRWHPAPDGGACFADGSGWIYVSNSEMDDGDGGVGALRFAADGTLLEGYRILDGSDRNCAGGATPWGTWLSCEETSTGVVYETFPQGGREAVRHEAMGVFRHEAAAVDPVRRCVYMTEDQIDGCFYRFLPAAYPDLSRGRLEVLCGEKNGSVHWEPVPDPSRRAGRTRRQVDAALHFDGPEGCVYGDDSVWFTTKGDGKVWRLHAPTGVLSLVYDEAAYDGAGSDGRGADAPVSGLDNLARSAVGELFIAEDKGSLDIGLISPNGRVSVFAHLVGHRGSEITGPAFSPDGSRLYFSSQRGRRDRDSDGYTFEISGPFHHLNRALPETVVDGLGQKD